MYELADDCLTLARFPEARGGVTKQANNETSAGCKKKNRRERNHVPNESTHVHRKQYKYYYGGA